LASAFLIFDGFVAFQWVHAPLLNPILSFLSGGLLLLSAFKGKRIGRSFRYLPGAMIAISGIVMVLSTYFSSPILSETWPVASISLGVALMGFGLSQFVLDGKRFLSISKRGVKFKHGIAPEQRFDWTQVVELFVEDKDIVLSIYRGKTLKFKPEPCDLQHLRSRVDGLVREAHQSSSKPLSPKSIVPVKEAVGK
jgi:hypothetical protein